MKSLIRAFALAALGMAGLASAPAHADLILSCSGPSGCGTLDTVSGNTTLMYGPHSFGHFTISNFTAVGQTDCGGACLVDINNFDMHSTGSGTLTIKLTETNLTAATFSNFVAAMSATLTVTGSWSDTRSFYLDTTNSGLLTTLLGSDGGSCSNSLCGESGGFSTPEHLSGQFSISEVITINARGSGSLSSGDSLSAFTVPEPATLGLLGTGLVALGAARRRRGRKGAAKA